MSAPSNPLAMTGLSFIEFSTNQPAALRKLFAALGFSRTHGHPTKDIELWTQNEIRLLLNFDARSDGMRFARDHGPTVSAMGWTFENPSLAYPRALERGGASHRRGDYGKVHSLDGIGGTLVYFVGARDTASLIRELELVPHPDPRVTPPKGFLRIDHLTNNVTHGTMATWRKFYQEVFGFRDVRTFDIRGQKTGLHSYALRSPDGSFCIPINEAAESKSQINEYLVRHRGPGVQHLAFLSSDLLTSLDGLHGTGIETLDIQPSYYDHVFKRVPGVREDPTRIRAHNVLVDGDEQGYLLQIFTKDLVGPLFIELIQRNNHASFGEGNFQALFDSIERDQEKRGVL